MSDNYGYLLDNARANKWRVKEPTAKSIARYAVERGEIEPKFEDRLAYKLQFGELMRTKEGGWVCTTCGGNCGQCGMTDMVGNPGFSFDRIVGGINPDGHKPLDVEARSSSVMEAIKRFFRGIGGA